MEIACIAVMPAGYDTFVTINCKKGRGIIMPGGKWEEGESFEECARRELLEETGISAPKGQYLFGGPDGFGYFVYAFLYPNYKDDSVSDTCIGDEVTMFYGWDALLRSHYSAYYEVLKMVIESTGGQER